MSSVSTALRRFNQPSKSEEEEVCEKFFNCKCTCFSHFPRQLIPTLHGRHISLRGHNHGGTMVQALDDYDVGQDLPQAMQLLGEMNNHVKQVSDLVENMLQKVKNGEMSTEYGLSFLEIKYHMLLTYLINLTYVVLRKCSGQTIENDPSIDRLIEIRTVLEKIRPIDHKLRYQIDKLVKTAQNTPTSGTLRANLGHAVTPLPEESAHTHESDSDEEEEENRKRPTKAGSSGVYMPPKHIPMYYDEEESKADRNRKQLERAKKRSIGMSIIEDLQEEYLDTPVEISGTSKAQQMISRAQKEKEEFEETYLTRLPVTKAEKQRQRRLTTLGTLGDELTRFGDGSSKNKAGKRKRKGAAKKRGGKKRKIK